MGCRSIILSTKNNEYAKEKSIDLFLLAADGRQPFYSNRSSIKQTIWANQPNTTGSMPKASAVGSFLSKSK
jgi:hypothetical protein